MSTIPQLFLDCDMNANGADSETLLGYEIIGGFSYHSALGHANEYIRLGNQPCPNHSANVRIDAPFRISVFIFIYTYPKGAKNCGLLSSPCSVDAEEFRK